MTSKPLSIIPIRQQGYLILRRLTEQRNILRLSRQQSLKAKKRIRNASTFASPGRTALHCNIPGKIPRIQTSCVSNTVVVDVLSNNGVKANTSFNELGVVGPGILEELEAS
jgi:hypothetical protein